MTTKTKEGALKAARKKLGENAVEGVDFNLRNTGAGWDFDPIPAANEAAAKAKTKRAPKPGVADLTKSKVVVSAAGLKALAEREPNPKKAAKLRSAADAKVKKARANIAARQSERDTKTHQFMEMLKAPGGATSKELEQAMGWKSHSVRGLIGTLKQRGETIVSKKRPGEPTYYQLVAPSKGSAPAAPEVGDVI